MSQEITVSIIKIRAPMPPMAELKHNLVTERQEEATLPWDSWE